MRRSPALCAVMNRVRDFQLDLRVCGYPLHSESRSLSHVQDLEGRRVSEGGYDASRFRQPKVRNGYGETEPRIGQVVVGREGAVARWVKVSMAGVAGVAGAGECFAWIGGIERQRWADRW